MGGGTSRVQRLVDQEFEDLKSKATPSSLELVRPAVFDRSHIMAVTMSHLVRQTLVLNQIESLQGVKFPNSVTRINLVRDLPEPFLHTFMSLSDFIMPILLIHLNRCHTVQYRLYPLSIVDLRPFYRAKILSQASTASFSQLVWLASIWWAVSRILWHLLSICMYLSHFSSIRQPTTSQVCAALYSPSSWHILSLCAPNSSVEAVSLLLYTIWIFIIRSFNQSSNRISSLEGCVLPDGLNELQLVRCSCIMNAIQILFDFVCWMVSLSSLTSQKIVPLHLTSRVFYMSVIMFATSSNPTVMRALLTRTRTTSAASTLTYSRFRSNYRSSNL